VDDNGYQRKHLQIAALLNAADLKSQDAHNLVRSLYMRNGEKKKWKRT
jgi:hypothetical protein